MKFLAIIAVIVSLYIYYDARKKATQLQLPTVVNRSLFFPIIVIPFYFYLTLESLWVNTLERGESLLDSFCPKCGELFQKKMKSVHIVVIS